ETAPDEAADLRGALRASLAAWRSRLFALTGCYEGPGDILAFAPDGQTAWVAEPDGSVRRRVITTGEAIGPPLRQDARITAVAVGRDGEVVLTAAGKVACLWEVAQGKLSRTFHQPSALKAIACSPDGQTLVTAYDSGVTIRRWDTRTGQEVTPAYISKESIIRALTVSPDGETLLATGGDLGTIHAWELATGKSLGPLAVPQGRYKALVFSPDGRG